MELDEFLIQCKNCGIIPFNGMFFDIEKSFDYFKVNKDNSYLLDNEIYNKEVKYIRTKYPNLKFDINIEDAIKFIKEKRNLWSNQLGIVI